MTFSRRSGGYACCLGAALALAALSGVTDVGFASPAGTAPKALNLADEAPAQGQAEIDAVVKSYLAVQKLLAADQVDGVAAELAKIRKAADALAIAGDEKTKAPAQAVTKHAQAEVKDLKHAKRSSRFPLL